MSTVSFIFPIKYFMYSQNTLCIHKIVVYLPIREGFRDSPVGKESVCNAGDLSLISGLGRAPREGKGYPLQYSGLESSMDCIIVHGVAKSRTRLSDFHFPVHEVLPSGG